MSQTFNSINCFLIRDPDLVTASFLNKWNDANPMDLGYKQQLEIFNLISNLNGVCPIIDASILLDNPEHVLKKLCLTIGIPWGFKNAFMEIWFKRFRWSLG